MQNKIKKGLSALRDAALSVLAQHILDSMKGNTNFVTPVPALATIQTALTDYDAALAEAKNRDKDKVLVKNQRRKDLVDLVNQLFDYVNLTGGTNIEVLASSGFPVAKDRKPVGEMPKPENFKVILGDGAGMVKTGLKKIHGADSYVYQFSPVGGSDAWETINDPRTRIIVNGLKPGTAYQFRASAVGAKGQGPWSDVITRYAA